MVELEEIQQRISSMSDDELYDMLGADYDQYRQDALKYARAEVLRRGLSYQATPGTNESESDRRYSTEWREYRRRSRLYWIVILGFLPFELVIGVPFDDFTHTKIPFYVTFFLCGAVLAAATFYLSSWKCPRCQKPFLRTWWYGNLFASRCVHCKLPKWSGS